MTSTCCSRDSGVTPLAAAALLLPTARSTAAAKQPRTSRNSSGQVEGAWGKPRKCRYQLPAHSACNEQIPSKSEQI
jgi:hypothetical protein